MFFKRKDKTHHERKSDTQQGITNWDEKNGSRGKLHFSNWTAESFSPLRPPEHKVKSAATETNLPGGWRKVGIADSENLTNIFQRRTADVSWRNVRVQKRSVSPASAEFTKLAPNSLKRLLAHSRQPPPTTLNGVLLQGNEGLSPSPYQFLVREEPQISSRLPKGWMKLSPSPRQKERASNWKVHALAAVELTTQLPALWVAREHLQKGIVGQDLSRWKGEMSVSQESVREEIETEGLQNIKTATKQNIVEKHSKYHGVSDEAMMIRIRPKLGQSAFRASLKNQSWDQSTDHQGNNRSPEATTTRFLKDSGNYTSQDRQPQSFKAFRPKPSLLDWKFPGLSHLITVYEALIASPVPRGHAEEEKLTPFPLCIAETAKDLLPKYFIGHAKVNLRVMNCLTLELLNLDFVLVDSRYELRHATTHAKYPVKRLLKKTKDIVTVWAYSIPFGSRSLLFDDQTLTVETQSTGSFSTCRILVVIP